MKHLARPKKRGYGAHVIGGKGVHVRHEDPTGPVDADLQRLGLDHGLGEPLGVDLGDVEVGDAVETPGDPLGEGEVVVEDPVARLRPVVVGLLAAGVEGEGPVKLRRRGCLQFDSAGAELKMDLRCSSWLPGSG